MSRSYQHKKRNSSDHSDSSEFDHENRDHDQSFDQCRACIVCPPCDFREKYESSSSDSDMSCPDFSDLCEDKPRICCEKKELCKKKPRKDELYSEETKSSEYSKSEDSQSEYVKSEETEETEESEESEDSVKEKKRKGHKRNGCNGCNRQCHNCAQCRSCGCRECIDFSHASVLHSLGGKESKDDCPNFSRIACDEKKKCCELIDPCKHKKRNEKKYNKKEESDDSAPVVRRQVSSDSASVVRKEVSSDAGSRKQAIVSEKKELAVLAPSDKKEQSGSSSSKGKKFVVTFGPKEGHQWSEYNEDSESVYINGKNGPVIHLYRGCTYFFCVDQAGGLECPEAKHCFVLTNSPLGGLGSRQVLNGFAPVSKGCVCFKVNKSTPRYFFYQDSKQSFEGGLVIVHDKS